MKRIANRFRDARYDIKVVLYELLTSDAFYAKENRGVLIKSPIDLVVGTLKQFDLKPSEPVPFAVAAAAMGQNLFSPPNVKGWPGGEAWINSSTLLARKQFLDRLFRADDPAGRMAAPPPEALAPRAQAGRRYRAACRKPTRERRDPVHAGDGSRLQKRAIRKRHVAQRSSRPPTPRARAAATRLLLAYAPQSPPDPASEPLAMVRHIVLDAAYQLK